MDEIKQQIRELQDFNRSLQSAHSIPLAVYQAFSERFVNSVIMESTKSADSEDVTVNEAGAGSYAVLGDPVGFIKINVNGKIRQIPYFNA